MDAYDVEKVESFKKLGMSVGAITAYDDTLLVAVKGGSLLQYRATLHFDIVNKRQKVKLSLTQHNTFSAKPVTKMRAIKECSLLIVVADNMCNVYDLDTFELKTSLPSTRGVSDFAIYVQEKLDNNKKIQVNSTVKMCVAIGKKLKVLQWDGETFKEIVKELVLNNPVKELIWCKDIVFVGVADEYFALKPESGHVHDVLRLNTHQLPIMTKVAEDTVLLGHANQSVFFNSLGHMTEQPSITWSGIPSFMMYDPPYAVAVLDKYVEVKTVQPMVSVQRMEIKHVEAACQSESLIFLLTHHNVHMLVPKPDYDRKKHLLQNKQYEIAIQIINQSKLSMEDKEEDVNRVKAQWAVHLFCLQKYVKSMNIFVELKTDPLHVVGMMTDFLPSKFHNSLAYPEKIPSLHSSELKEASAAMVDYLVQKRQQITSQETLVPFTKIIPHNKKNDTLKNKEQALSVIDTTLLKCYLQTDVRQIEALLRQPDSHVSVEEAQKLLLDGEQFHELIILYEIHRMHKEALEMMKSEATKRKSTLSGTDMTVHYLQKLGEPHLKLIFQYAGWVFEDDPFEGLKIFTENDPVVKNLPRGHVASFIEDLSKESAILYLEHIIYQWQDKTEELHLMLAHLLRELVTTLYEAYVKRKSAGSRWYGSVLHQQAGEEPDKLGTYRKKLLLFLRTSENYKPAEVLTKLPLDSLFEERAILLGRMKRHTEALGIYVYILQDLTQAEVYCNQIYDKSDKEDKEDRQVSITHQRNREHLNNQVYLHLLKTYLHPPDSKTLGLSKYQDTPKPNTIEALAILEQHAAHIDLCQALEILPDDLSIKKLRSYLEVAFETRVSYKKLCQAKQRIEYAENLQVNKERILYSKKSFQLSEDTCCGKCNRKIGKSVFAYFLDGTKVHYGCIRSHSRTPSSESSHSVT